MEFVRPTLIFLDVSFPILGKINELILCVHAEYAEIKTTRNYYTTT